MNLFLASFCEVSIVSLSMWWSWSSKRWYGGRGGAEGAMAGAGRTGGGLFFFELFSSA